MIPSFVEMKKNISIKFFQECNGMKTSTFWNPEADM